MESVFPTDRKPRRMRRYIVLAAALVLLLVFVTVGFTTDWFGLYGPVTKIALAGVNTFKAESFTADFTVSSGDLYAEGTLQLYMDPEQETVEAYLEVNAGKTAYIAAIYDSTLIYGTEKKLFSKDISAQLQEYFRKQKESPKKIRSLDDVTDLLLDWIPEQLRERINESYLDLDETKLLLKSFLTQKLNRTSWLKEHAGYRSYRVDGVLYHRFQSEKGQLLADTAEHFKPAFKSEKLYSQLWDSAEAMGSSGTSTQILIAIEDGCLKKLEAVTTGPKKSSSFTLAFREIGSAVPNRALLRELYEKATA